MQQNAASYRDNAGFIFEHASNLFRFLHPVYFEHYDRLMQSGLYTKLVEKGSLVAHEETPYPSGASLPPGGRILQPQRIPFISYPYEWSFGQWRDAALLTVSICRTALEHGMILKDATPFNVQFTGSRAVFIDTASFAIYKEGEPWIAYHQFCQAFLGPLLLMHYGHPAAGRLITAFPEGIPLDMLVTLLPARSKWKLQVNLHIHLQAKMAARQSNAKSGRHQLSRKQLELLLKGMESLIGGLRVKSTKTTWDDYYTGTISGNNYLGEKTTLVNAFLDGAQYTRVIDLGANDGHFSMLLKDKAAYIVAMDADPNCIGHLHEQLREKKVPNILPLVADLMAPSPSIGWANKERTSLTERCQADLVMALALVHHLAIGRNVPLLMIAAWLAPMAPLLLIEFVPKEDEKVQVLLQNREDIFDGYDLEHFKNAFRFYYHIEKESVVGNTQRTLLLMKRR